MENNENNISITALLKRLREQANAGDQDGKESGDDTQENAPDAENEEPEEEKMTEEEESSIRAELSDILRRLHSMKQEEDEDDASEEAASPDPEEEEKLANDLKDLIRRLNRQAAETPDEPEEAEETEETEEPSVSQAPEEPEEAAPESIPEKENAKKAGMRYRFTVTKKNASADPPDVEVAPSEKEYEEAKQDVADYSEEKAETKEAPSFSGWKKLKSLFGFGKEKAEAPAPDEKEEETAAEDEPGETEEETAPEEAASETGYSASFREDDGTKSPAALFYAANNSPDREENRIVPDPDLFERIREEYPVATNDTEEEQKGDAEAEQGTDSEPEAEPLSDGDLNQMINRFLSEEKKAEYAKDTDLKESRRRMRQIRLDDPEAGTQEKPEKKGDTKEIPSAPAAKTEEFEVKKPKSGIPDSETFFPPEIGPEDEEEEETINKDISILIAFGREQEAREKYGDARIDLFLRDISGSGPAKKEEEPEEEPVYPEKEETEYENFGQNKEFFRLFKKKYRISIIRMILCGILIVLAFLLENYDLLGITPIPALDPELFPLVYVMADLQLLVLGCLLVRHTFSGGVKALLRREPDPSVFVLLAGVCCFAYTVYAAFLPAGRIRLYTFPLLLLFFVSLLCGFFDLRREIMTFRVVSSKRTKYVIGALSGEEAALEEEAFENYLPDEPTLFRLGKANFVDGFFRRSRKTSSAKKILLLVPPFACAVGLAFLAMAVFFGGETGSAVTVGITALMMSLPAAMLLTYSYPFYTASCRSYDTDSAIVGECSLDEYCDAASISFEDNDVFPSRGVKVRSVMVFGENRIDEVINNVTSVFHVAGGPLSDVLDIITSDLHPDENTRLLSVAPDGIEADVSGTHLYLGKTDYLRRNHYVPILSDEDREIERTGNLSIMFVVSDDEVVAKFYLNYRIDPDFEKILKQMYRSGICVGIKTFDPNIDDDMLSRRIRIERYPVRVLKCREIGEEPRVADRADSGIVSKHSAKALLGAFAVCGKVQTVTRIGIVLNFISLFAAAMVMGVTMLFGAADKIASLYVALYQLFWTIPIFVMSRVHVKQ